MSRLIRIFTVSLVYYILFQYLKYLKRKQGRCPNLHICPNIPDLTLPLLNLQSRSDV